LQIKLLPSPRRQREELEKLVRERTAEKDKAILDMYHSVGNILAISAAAIRLTETRGGDQRELRRQALARIQEIADAHQQISEPYRRTVAVGSSGELLGARWLASRPS
jgi:two-component sensor histidine kinase